MLHTFIYRLLDPPRSLSFRRKLTYGSLWYPKWLFGWLALKNLSQTLQQRDFLFRFQVKKLWKAWKTIRLMVEELGIRECSSKRIASQIVTISSRRFFSKDFGLTFVKSPNLQLDATSVPANSLEGVPEERLSFHLTTNLSSLDANGALTRTGFCGQMRAVRQHTGRDLV